jgi:AcrR family transcriptional regulator
MSRWEPNARERLEEAALTLFGERGFEQTTVAEIAALAGLTERTFFRHFADKREVLFWGQSRLRDLLVSSVENAPPSASPLEAVKIAVESVGEALEPRRAITLRRQSVIVSNPELQERELSKFGILSAAISDALRHRGATVLAADLAAEAALAVFRISFRRWIEETPPRAFPAIIRESFDELKAVAAGSG